METRIVTNEFESLFEILSEVLLVAIRGRETFVAEQTFLIMVEREVSGDVDYVADVQPLDLLQVLSIMFIAEKEEGQDGGELGILNVWSGSNGLR